MSSCDNKGEITMHSEFKLIDKVEADRLLGMNTSNRPISRSNVETIKRAMLSGEWIENGESIKISYDGILLDGQHRLIAVSETNSKIMSLVVSGLPKDAFTTIDIGKTRGAGDMLALKGVRNYNHVSAAARLYMIWKKTGSIKPINDNPSKTQVVNLVLSDSRFEDAAQVVQRKFSKKYISPSMCIFLRVAFDEYDKGASTDFFNELEEPTYTPHGKVVLQLREQLISMSSGRDKVSKYIKAAITFKAFSYFCSGKSPKLLFVRTTGESAEKDIYSVKKL